MLLIASELKPEDQEALTNKDEATRKAVLRKVVGLKLSGRDLRYADFSKSLLPKVDFREVNGIKTDLRNANFLSATLTKAIMYKVLLQDAFLQSAKLTGATLRSAKVQICSLPT